MAVEGELQDIPASSLVQTMCCTGKRTGMVLTNLVEEGALFFDGGEIVHARVGLLEGEEAVYHLLAWTKGRFRISEDIGTTARSVKRPWNELLMEGMRRLDEGQEAMPVLASLDPERDRLEERLEARLLSLLSQLEQDAVRLEHRSGGTASGLVTGLIEIVNRVLDFQDRAEADGLRTAPLIKALALANARFPYARFLEAAAGRLSARVAAHMYETWEGAMDRRSYIFRQLAQASVWVLGEYLAMFGKSFRSEGRERQWKEIYEVFIKDLERINSAFEF